MGSDLESPNDEGTTLLPCWGQSHSAFEQINAKKCSGHIEVLRNWIYAINMKGILNSCNADVTEGSA